MGLSNNKMFMNSRNTNVLLGVYSKFYEEFLKNSSISKQLLKEMGQNTEESEEKFQSDLTSNSIIAFRELNLIIYLREI